MSNNISVCVSKISCQKCSSEIEYDEGEGNFEDGYICYECLEKMKDEMIDNEIEEIKLRKSSCDLF